MRDDEVLRAYLREIEQFEQLPSDEERRLLALVARGDGNAKRRVIEGNLRDAVSLALGACPEGMRLLDAIQEANVVLARLVEDARGTPLDRTRLNRQSDNISSGSR